IAAGLIGEEFVSSEPAAAPMPDWQSAGPLLSRDQEWAAERLVERVREGGFSVTVLDGVTGSGKTETYFAAIAAALAAGRQVLVLLPEIALVLVSATPSLETVVNVARGRYERVHLPRRHAEASLPKIDLVDMRGQRLEPGRFLSPPLVAAVGETLAAGEQVLLFLNRRGYAPLTLCRACGHRFQCPNCTAWLVEHRFTARLICHHCGYSAPVPALCPECLTTGALVPCGPGVERLQEEVAARFPEARTALMVSDLLMGPRAAAELADAMVAHRYD